MNAENRPGNYSGTEFKGNKGPSNPYPIITLDTHEPTLWLRAAVQHAAATGRPCHHLRRGDIGTITLNNPDAILCPACAETQFLTTTGTDQDQPCDRCGELRRGKLTACAVKATPNLLIGFGLCPTCWTREAGPTP